MTVKEKIERERENRDKILIYSDGGEFARCYNQSAFAFYQHIQQFKVLASLNKALNEVCVYIGFNIKYIDNYLKNYTTDVIDEKAKLFTVQLDKPIPMDEYENWKIQKIAEAEHERQQKAEEDAKRTAEKEKIVKAAQTNVGKTTKTTPEGEAEADSDAVINEILSVNLLKFSPIDALVFLGDIQAKLRKNYDTASVLPVAEAESTTKKEEKLPFEE